MAFKQNCSKNIPRWSKKKCYFIFSSFYIFRKIINFVNLHKIYKERGSFSVIVQVRYCPKKTVFAEEKRLGKENRTLYYFILEFQLRTLTFATVSSKQKKTVSIILIMYLEELIFARTNICEGTRFKYFSRNKFK